MCVGNFKVYVSWDILAAELANSFPLIPVWLGIQKKIISFLLWPFSCDSLLSNFAIRGLSVFLFFIAFRAESEKIMSLGFLLLEIRLSAKVSACISALKIGFFWEVWLFCYWFVEYCCTGCCIILFRSICVDVYVVWIFFFDFVKIFLESSWMYFKCMKP